MSDEKKNSFAVESQLNQEIIQDEILTFESAKLKFPNCDDDFYNQIVGKPIDQAWDLLIDLDQTSPTAIEIKMSSEIAEIRKKYFGTDGKKFCFEVLKIHEKFGLDQSQPYKTMCDQLRKFVN